MCFKLCVCLFVKLSWVVSLPRHRNEDFQKWGSSRESSCAFCPVFSSYFKHTSLILNVCKNKGPPSYLKDISLMMLKHTKIILLFLLKTIITWTVSIQKFGQEIKVDKSNEKFKNTNRPPIVLVTNLFWWRISNFSCQN